MNIKQPFGSETFRQVARGLVALHRLIKVGNDDTLEAESIRDRLDAPLRALTRIEKERSQWLSEDLYSVSEPSSELARKEMNPQAQLKLCDAYEAQKCQDWDRALTLLRRWKEYIPPVLLCYFRGTIWLDASYPEVAVVFFEHALESNPSDDNCRAVYIHALAGSDLDAADNRAKEVLADHERYSPSLVAQSAAVRVRQGKAATPTEFTQLCRELIPILERNMARVEQDPSASAHSPDHLMTLHLLGFCHLFLGNVEDAGTVYSRGLKQDPGDQGLLIARGALRYGVDSLAVGDFERAVELGSPVIWPYLFLAHHYLFTTQFEKCRVICETGLRMQGPDNAKSQLEEWRAIALAELDFPAEYVRSAFDAAVRLDPSNDLARRNQAILEASFTSRPATSPLKWEHRSEATVRNIGLAGLRYSLVA